MNEHDEQVKLVNWAKRLENKHPELALLFAIPNGGKRHIAVAKKLKDEGVKAGVPDLFLAIPALQYSGDDSVYYNGLFIEIKFGKNKLTKNQEWWIRQLENRGYRCEVCYGFEKAKAVICDYLRIEEVL